MFRKVDRILRTRKALPNIESKIRLKSTHNYQSIEKTLKSVSFSSLFDLVFTFKDLRMEN